MLNFSTGTPESTGISASHISNFVKRLQNKGVAMHSFLLLHKDTLIAEGYYKPYDADTLHRMFSISKSFTAIAIGLLMDEGKLSLDDTIIDYFPDKLPKDVHPWIANMTIRDMLMMRTCHAATTYKVNMKEDWVESFFTVAPTHPSGKLFHYDTSSAHVLCALAERLSGMPMLDYIKSKLSVLGISEKSYMLTDPFGVSMGGSGLVATPKDILKFGYFLLKEGNINGEVLLSSSYIKDATSHLTDTCLTGPVPSECQGYGYQIWRNERGGYVCYGMGGQLVIVLPQYDLICVTTADTQGLGGGNQLIYDAFYDEILDKIAPAPLLEDPVACTKLAELFESLELPMLDDCSKNKDFLDFVRDIQDSHWKFEDNPQGFTDLSICFSPEKDGAVLGGILTLTLQEKEIRLPFGIGTLITDTFPGYDMKYAANATLLADHTLYIKFHIIDAFVGSVHLQLSFAEDEVTVFMRKQEESLFWEYNGHLFGLRV